MRDPRFRRGWEEHPPTPPSSIERAKQLAAGTASGPADMDRLSKAREERKLLPGHTWTVFHDELVDQARPPDGHRARAWAKALAERARTLIEDPGSFALLSRDGGAVRALAEARRRMGDPFDVWSDPWLRRSDTPARDTEILMDLGLAVRISPGEGLQAIERLPTLEMMSLSLMGLEDDREVIEEMIAAAPRVFDPIGQWGADRPVTALLAIEQILRHASKLDAELSHRVWALKTGLERGATEPQIAAAEAARQSVREVELPAWMRSAFGLVVAREDGRALASGYLSHLARQVLLGRGRAAEDPWSAPEYALDALAAVLRDKGAAVTEVRRAWERHEALAAEKAAQRSTSRRVGPGRSAKRDAAVGEGARTLHGQGLPWLVGAAYLLGADPHDPAELCAFWAWMEELLTGRDDGLSLMFHDDVVLADVTRRLGFLVSRVPDFQRRLQAAFSCLEPQRRRARHGFKYEEVDLDEPSVLLIRVGLYAIVNHIEDVRKASAAAVEAASAARAPLEEAFFQLFDAARGLWLTAVLDTSDRKSILVPLCLAFAPFVFRERISEALCRMVPPIANDPRQLGLAAWFFWRNDDEEKDAARTSRLFREAGADLEAALRDVHQWSVLTGRKEDFPEELRSLSEALGLALDAPAPTLENTAVTKRKRQDLLRAFPWGAALLQRIDDAGCTLRRLWQVGSHGDAWGLQVELPPALQDDMGLAAQLRILAVRGAVTGADLRRVIEDPVEREHVDADVVVVAGDHPRLSQRVPLLGGPWGQRVTWAFGAEGGPPFIDALHDGLRAVDVFDRRDPVPPHALVGRSGQVQEIASMLAQGRAVGVLGLRKVGKTSLLRAVATALDPVGAAPGREKDERDSRESSTDTLVVLLDVQSLTKRTLDAVAGQLARRLSRRLEALPGHSHSDKHPPHPDARAPLPIVKTPSRGEVANVYKENSVVDPSDGHSATPDGVPGLSPEVPSLPPLAELDSLITRILETTSLQVCFLVDEYDLLFEGYGGEPGVPGIERLFALLRGRAQLSGRIGMALVGRDPVFLERPLLFGFTNPLLGWTVTRWLGPLEPEDAATLLRSLGRRVGLDVGPATIESAFRWTGGHPLLLRQFGAAARECAIVHSPRGWPVATDAFLEQTERKYRARPMVETACGEIRALLSARFPEAYRLLADVASAPPGELEAFLASHGGEEAPAAALLVHFGLLFPGAPAWIPATFRRAFGEAAGAGRAGASG